VQEPLIASAPIVVGQEVVRFDAEDKARGKAKFADDLIFSSMLYGSVIRSTRPHARLKRVDLSPVTSHPNVLCTVTADEIPGENVVHVIYDDQPVLAAEIVRYIGEPIALVAAADRRSAQEAACRATIEYVDQPAVFEPRIALAPEAPRVAQPAVSENGNLFNHMRVRKGEIDRGFAEADVVVEGEYHVGYHEHVYLETQGMIAVPEEGGGIALYGSLQCPFYVQAAVAQVLGLPLAKVRVIATAIGGAFGGKEDVPSQIGALAALLAWKSNRPVKLVYERKEDITTTSKRHPATLICRTGAKRDGILTAVEMEFFYNAGAYQTLSSAVLWRAIVHAAGPYRVPHVKVDGYSVATNTVPCGAFRGFGSPQVIFAQESQIDRLADQLKIDRVEIRKRNALVIGDKTATGQRLHESVGLQTTIKRAVDLVKWSDRLAAIRKSNSSHHAKRRGIGISTVMYGVGMGGKAPMLEKAGAYIKLEPDGSISVAVGNTEMGQGAMTVLAQIAAETMKVAIDRVQLVPVDSSRVPDSGPTVASRTTTIAGLAIIDAGQRLRRRISAVAGELNINTEEGITARINEIARHMWMENINMGALGWAEGKPVDWQMEEGYGNAYFVYSYATHIAEVEVDLITGATSVERFIAVHDSGKIINPQTAAGQVEGGIAQGIGYVLTEEMISREGKILTDGLTAYRIPTIADIPQAVVVEFVEDPYPAGPFGAKGLGEVPLMASHAAVANAISHAVGRRLDHYPASPERVKELLSYQ